MLLVFLNKGHAITWQFLRCLARRAEFGGPWIFLHTERRIRCEEALECSLRSLSQVLVQAILCSVPGGHAIRVQWFVDDVKIILPPDPPPRCSHAQPPVEMFENGDIDVEGKTVLELGAGAGLPGLVCALVRNHFLRRRCFEMWDTVRIKDAVSFVRLPHQRCERKHILVHSSKPRSYPVSGAPNSSRDRPFHMTAIDATRPVHEHHAAVSATTSCALCCIGGMPVKTMDPRPTTVTLPPQA